MVFGAFGLHCFEVRLTDYVAWIWGTYCQYNVAVIVGRASLLRMWTPCGANELSHIVVRMLRVDQTQH